MIGVGYRAAVAGNNLTLSLGYSHPIEMPIPSGLEVKVEKNTNIAVGGWVGGPAGPSPAPGAFPPHQPGHGTGHTSAARTPALPRRCC